MRLGSQLFEYYRNSNEPISELERLIKNIEKANSKRLIL